MAKLILYSPYYKATDYRMGKYVRYIATREGVELPKNTKLNRPATKKQKDLIENMLKDFPNCYELLEYKDYLDKPTIENASEFITRVLEANVHSENMGGYVKYMANRPGAEKLSGNGLFSDNNTPIVLSKVEQELNNYEGNVWTHIISLKREDAARLGFDNVKAWQGLLTAKRNEIAKNMNINPENFKWYAAFHNESHHPHIHMVAYSTKPTEAYLSKKGIRNIKSCLAKEIFKNDLIQIYKEQTDIRDRLKTSSKEIAENLIENIIKGNFQNENIERLLFDLNDKLKRTSGKKVYGYLKPEVKLIVNQIVDELEKEENIKSLYVLWYEQKDKITSNYTSEKLKRIPLSVNKEFKSIRNMVIKEALSIDNFNLTFDDEISTKPVMISIDETEGYAGDDNTNEDYFDFALNSSEKYWKAKRLLDENSKEYDFEKGFALLKLSAKEGNQYAQYKLGRILIVNELSEEDIDEGVYWLGKACEQGNEYAEYYLGKQYLGNGKVDENYKRAIHLLSESASEGNKYAKYSLACQYLFSDKFKDKIKEGLELLEGSADKKFAPAEKMLAFIILKGELLPKDEMRAYNLLLHSVSLGDDKAEYALAKLLLNSDVIPKDAERAIKLLISAIEKNNEWAKVLLGKMLLFGIDIQKNEEKGIELLQSAAEQGNEHAVKILQNRDNHLKYLAAMSAMRLFGYMGNLFGKKFNTDKSKTGFRIDKKQRRQIEEKKMAQGLRS